MAVDNISAIPGWWSDALCKAVTGDGLIRRRLYTDGDLAVSKFRCVVALTSIDAGALRGDLADRLLLLDLEPIDESQRRSEAELDQAFRRGWPGWFGALLDLLAAVLGRLPNIKLEKMPRMADFARVLAAIDETGEVKGPALDLYLRQRNRIAGDVIEGDPVASAIVELMEADNSWSGTSGELLDKIKPERPSKVWPSNGQAMTGRLKRLIPALKGVGIAVTIPKQRSNRGRVITIESVGKASSLLSHSSPDAADGASGPNHSDDPPIAGGGDCHGDRHRESGDHQPETPGSDNSDDLLQQPSGKRRSVRI